MTTHRTTKMAGQTPSELFTTLAHHDAAISTLGGRMTGVESSVRTLQGEVHSGFSVLGGKLDKLDARPSFNFGEMVRTVLSLAVLFSMVVGGIIWVTTAQFAGVVAEQRSLNTSLNARMERHETVLERIGWAAKVEVRR
jgi:hypothetical protein